MTTDDCDDDESKRSWSAHSSVSLGSLWLVDAIKRALVRAGENQFNCGPIKGKLIVYVDQSDLSVDPNQKP